MRILIFGAGAIGSLLGHLLWQAGHEVTLVGRRDYVRAVQERGLILEQRGMTSVARPRATESVADLPADDRAWELILLTVKAYDTEQAARALARHVKPDTPLLIVQNGVGGEELLQQVLPQAMLISGVITWPVSVLAAGHVALESTRGGASLSPTQAGQKVDRWATLLTSAGVKTSICQDYRAQKWSKLLLNILANAVPAILDMAPGAVFADPRLFAVERAAFLEALAVMRALRLTPVAFPQLPLPLLVWAMQVLPTPLLRPVLRGVVASGRGEKKPSLQIDLARGRERSEVLYLNGAIAAYAQRLGLDAPVNRVLTETVLGIATASMPWDEFRGQPQKLIARIQDTGCRMQGASRVS